jgi:hypothetical protein
VRVRLKGLHFVPKKLADGRVREYAYAWRGGPRILGQPGSPEFLASYNEAISRRAAPQVGTMRSVLAAYEADVEAFGGLAERTKADYNGKLRLIERLKRALDAAKAARGAVTTVLVTTEGMPSTTCGVAPSPGWQLPAPQYPRYPQSAACRWAMCAAFSTGTT